MMPLDIDTIKKHLRIPHDLEDDVLVDYLSFAKQDVIEAIFDAYDHKIKKDELNKDPTFKRAVIMLTTYYYENRMNISEIRQYEAPFSVTHAIQNLRAHRDRYYED